MLQGHQTFPAKRQHMVIPQQSSLLRRHPVMMPVLLIGSAVGLFIVSFFANSLFPLLALIGAPPTIMCLLLALVLGICGILASIISIIEKIDRSRFQAPMFTQPEEGV